MQFFLPNTGSPEEAEKAYQAIREFVGSQSDWTIGEQRIYSSSYQHDVECTLLRGSPALLVNPCL